MDFRGIAIVLFAGVNPKMQINIPLISRGLMFLLGSIMHNKAKSFMESRQRN